MTENDQVKAEFFLHTKHLNVLSKSSREFSDQVCLGSDPKYISMNTFKVT